MGGLLLSDDQRGAAGRALAVVVDVPLRDEAIGAVEQRVAGDHHAVADFHRTDAKR
jgi:hypothetical protein